MAEQRVVVPLVWVQLPVGTHLFFTVLLGVINILMKYKISAESSFLIYCRQLAVDCCSSVIMAFFSIGRLT